MSFLVSTVGSTVILKDLGITIVHPTIDRDLSVEFTATELAESVLLTTAINSGTLTLKVVDDEYNAYTVEPTEYYAGFSVQNQFFRAEVEDYVTQDELSAGLLNKLINPAATGLSVTSTAASTKNVYVTSGKFQKWKLAPGDKIVITGGAAAGTYTVATVTDQFQFVVVESIIDSSGTGTLAAYHPVSSTRVGVNTTGFSHTSGLFLQKVIEDFDVKIIDLTSSAPTNVTKTTATAGAATQSARADHKHDISTTTAISTGAANTEGSSTSLARADHTHAVVDLAMSGQTQGDIIYFNGTNWVRLAAGTNEAVLQTQGAGADPRWVLPVRSTATGTTSSPTTTSASFVVIPQMTLTITTQGGDVFVDFDCTFNLQDDDSFNIQIFVDGVALEGTLRHLEFHGASGLLGLGPGSIDGIAISLYARVQNLSAASHTFDVRWQRSAGTARARLTERQIQVIEVF